MLERARSVRLQIPESWEQSELVALLLVFTQTALVLFCVALYIAPFNLTALIIFAVGIHFHLSTLVISLLYCPPMSSVFRPLQGLSEILTNYSCTLTIPRNVERIYSLSIYSAGLQASLRLRLCSLCSSGPQSLNCFDQPLCHIFILVRLVPPL